MFRRTLALLLLLVFTLPLPGALAEGSRYTDTPPADWPEGAVERAAGYGLLEDLGEEELGPGNYMSRAAFAAVLCRVFGWEAVTPDTPTYTDCASGAWYYAAVETAAAHGVTGGASNRFRPEESITRAEMAVLLVQALGYESLAGLEGDSSLFSDVTADRGYIALACRFGLMAGVEQDGAAWFYPDAFAPREVALAALVRLYEKLTGDIDWLHGFYAFSSYSQIDLTAGMDAVSVGWAMMDVDPETGPWLNQTSQNGNSWVVPQQSELATGYFQENGTPCHLNVYAGPGSLTLPDGTVTNDLYGILETAQARTQAVELLVAAAADYDGLTIDFEGLRAALKEPFVTFMTELRAALPADKGLWVCVQPPDWYDGFDYRALGEVCDKVILMAHDYQWTSVPESYVGTGNTDTPVTPIRYIYTALRAITDPETGVADRSKVALAISIAAVAVEVDENGVLVGNTLYTPGPSSVIQWLRDPDTERGWSEDYRNPYLYCTTEDGRRLRVWYEDARSAMEKVQLAQLFGVTGVSLWRIGNIPNYADEGLDYDVWGALQTRR